VEASEAIEVSAVTLLEAEVVLVMRGGVLVEVEGELLAYVVEAVTGDKVFVLMIKEYAEVERIGGS